MPLEKSGSDDARKRNIETEIASGKDPKQAVAIGYSVQREAKKKCCYRMSHRKKEKK